MKKNAGFPRGLGWIRFDPLHIERQGHTVRMQWDILPSVSSVEGQNGVGVEQQREHLQKQTPQISMCCWDKGKDDEPLPV